MATPTTDAAPTSSKTITESQSWGDTIRSYENSKKSLPWNVNEVKPVERMSQLEVRALPTDFVIYPLILIYYLIEKT